MGENELIVDRIEDKILVVEYKESIVEININLIIGKVKEGDILVKKGEFYEVDHEKTSLRKEKIDSIMKGIWED